MSFKRGSTVECSCTLVNIKWLLRSTCAPIHQGLYVLKMVCTIWSCGPPLRQLIQMMMQTTNTMRKNRAPPAAATAMMMISVSGGGRGEGGRARNVNDITPLQLSGLVQGSLTLPVCVTENGAGQGTRLSPRYCWFVPGNITLHL